MKARAAWIGYAWAAATAVACTAAGWAMQSRFDPVNIAMVYLLGVVVVALRYSRGAAVAASVMSVAAFDFLFVPPRGTFTVDDVQYLLTFAIMLAVALVISSLTQAMRRHERQQAAMELEAETERIRSTLLASISHDLRTPLAVMEGASSLLAERGEGMEPRERRELAESVVRQSHQMSEHVAKVLQMTRLETGTVEVSREWTSLDEVAGAVLLRLKERLAQHRLVVELPRDLPLIRADAALIEQALGNLLENAARHTPPGTVVRLRAAVAAGELVVSVEDFGGGIPERDLERVFAMFHRGALEGREAGMGLGLAIARSIVRLHGGRAWAERIPAGGTAFRFSLPLEAQAPSAAREAEVG